MKVPCRGCDKLDAVTYPNRAVIDAVNARFVPVKLDLFKCPREVIRPLNVLWTPTILFADQARDRSYRSGTACRRTF